MSGSRTAFPLKQLCARDGSSDVSLCSGDLLKEQIALLAQAKVDFLIMETFFHLEEEC